jgi:anti-anti-sigma regulatory factor
VQREVGVGAGRKGVVTDSSWQEAHPAADAVAHFSIGIGRSGGTVVITIHGVSSQEDWARIDAVLRDIIDAQGNLDVVLDLGEVSTLESDAAPLIVHAAQRAHSHGGRLRLADRACRDRGQMIGRN